MSQLNCIIVDDEPLAIEILEEYVEKIPWLDCLATFDQGLSAIQFLEENPVDLVFLDIQMPDLTGIQVAELINGRTRIVFTTAYNQYAVEGFELEATDYLLKPISFERFFKSMQRIKPEVELDNKEIADYLFVKTEYKIKKIRLDDILYIEGMKDYLRLVLKNEKVMTLMSFSRLIPRLPSDKFLRVHKSYVISLAVIESIEKGKIRIGEDTIPISDTYKEEFFRVIENRAV